MPDPPAGTRLARLTIACCLAALPGWGAEPDAAAEIAQLRAQIEQQKRQIAGLEKALAEQSQTLERLAARMPAPASAAVAPVPKPAPPPAPLQLRLGAASLTPVAFVDFTAVFRDKTGGSSIGTNFGSIPFANTPQGHLSELRMSAQNSRFGMRVDVPVRGASLLGYLESDFLGFSPPNAAVSSNSNSLRLRLYWVDVRKGKYELLAGQSWSLLTPNRKGLSPLPHDLFYSQDVDVNYQVGLTWSRTPGIRLVYHPRSTVSLGVALESGEQYGGGSAGSGSITLPSALEAAYAGQVNLGSSTFNVPNLTPDLIVKAAWDPAFGRRTAHFEAAGVFSTFKLYNPFQGHGYTAAGGGGSLNFNIETLRNLRLFSNNFLSNGGGRWIFGQGPDLIVRSDGSPSPVRAWATLQGLEYQADPRTLAYAYYGNAYFGRHSEIDPATGRFVGYGYPGSPDNHNRSIQEVTLGATRTFWRDPTYGSLSLMAQFSRLLREPWWVAAGHPASTHSHMVFFNLRYAFPGAPPAAE
jgi:hypothetical protein